MARSMRNFRLDDDVYKAAQDKAKREYTNVTAVVERYLAAYSGLTASSETVWETMEAYAQQNAALHEENTRLRDENAALRQQAATKPLGYSKKQQTGRRS